MKINEYRFKIEFVRTNVQFVPDNQSRSAGLILITDGLYGTSRIWTKWTLDESSGHLAFISPYPNDYVLPFIGEYRDDPGSKYNIDNFEAWSGHAVSATTYDFLPIVVLHYPEQLATCLKLYKYTPNFLNENN